MANQYPLGLTDADFSASLTNPSWEPDDFLYGSHITFASSGTVTQLGVNCRGTASLKFGLYDSSGNLIAQSTGSVASGVLGWVNSGAISASVSAALHYVLVSCSVNTVEIGYRTAGGAGSFATEAYATAMQATETISGQAEANTLYGVRADFTAGGGGATTDDPLLHMREIWERVKAIGSGWKRHSDGRLLVPAYPTLRLAA